MGMKKVIMTLLVVGVVIGAVAMLMKRRSPDEWRSFAEDSYAHAKDAAKDATSHFGKDPAESDADTDSDTAS